MSIYKNIYIYIIFSFIPFTAFANTNISNARSVGLGGASIGLARGVDASIWNPANLGLPDNGRLSISLINLGVGIYNNSFTLQQYNTYNGSFWDENDIENILNSIPSDGMEISLTGNCQIASFSSGRIAFSIEALVQSKAKLGKDFFDFVLHANSQKEEHLFDDCDGEMWGIMSYNFSGGIPIRVSRFQHFAIGGTIKYLQGYGYMKIAETRGYRRTTSAGENAAGSMKINYASLGRGVSFDIGVSAKLNQNFSMGLSLKDFMNNIEWYKDTNYRYYSFSMDSVNLFNVLKEDSIIFTEETSEKISRMSSTLPVELHLGIAYSKPNYTFVLDYVQGFRDRAGSSPKPMFATGIEFLPVPWLPLRTGFSVGGDDMFSTSIGWGFKLGALALDFAASNRGGFILINQKGAQLAFGIGWWL